MVRVWKGKIISIIGLLLLLAIYIGTIHYHQTKPLPKGLSYESDVYHIASDQIQFLADLTYKQGNEHSTEQEIFNAVHKAIQEAEEFIVLDMFLYNDYYDDGYDFPSVSMDLTTALLEKKTKNPSMEIVLITDEINTSYGSHHNHQFDELKENGIEVLITDVEPLRDSNPLYSALWRMFFQWFGEEGSGHISNAMANQAPKMSLRSYLKLLNIKANHRKTVITEKTALVLSGNPHDASAYHSNIGFRIGGPIIRDLLQTEQAAANLASGYKLPKYEPEDTTGDIAVQLLTEGKVYEHVLRSLQDTQAGDEIWMAMFYLADRKVIEELFEADNRGVKIRLILDPNANAFGSKKSGLPNRPVAKELYEKTEGNINIRWYNTGEEQYHPKLMYIKNDQHALITGGSTNFTKRNLDDYNLETNISIAAPIDSKLADEMDDYFNRQWNNRDGNFTQSYEKNTTPLTTMQRLIYTLQKWSYFTTY